MYYWRIGDKTNYVVILTSVILLAEFSISNGVVDQTKHY